jgi:UDP-glucuronate 4-epimerase
MRALVTGGAGGIGSHLVDALLGRGDEVAVLDSFHEFYARKDKERNLQGALDHAAFAGVYEGDIRDQAFVRRTMREFQPDTVFHFAARAGVRPSVEHAVEYTDVNLNGTAVILAEAAASGASRLLFASSSTVYGDGARSPFMEDAETGRPVSPYGATKRGGELLCYAANRGTGLAVSCLRFFSAYGPRQRPDLAIAAWALALRAGKPIAVFGDGSVERDFTYVSDLIDGILRAADRVKGFHVYNLGRGQPYAMNRVIEILERELGVRAVRDVRPAHPADLPRTCASIERARTELGYAPSIDLEEGLRRYVRWLVQEDA